MELLSLKLSWLFDLHALFVESHVSLLVDLLHFLNKLITFIRVVIVDFERTLRPHKVRIGLMVISWWDLFSVQGQSDYISHIVIVGDEWRCFSCLWSRSLISKITCLGLIESAHVFLAFGKTLIDSILILPNTLIQTELSSVKESLIHLLCSFKRRLDLRKLRFAANNRRFIIFGCSCLFFSLIIFLAPSLQSLMHETLIFLLRLFVLLIIPKVYVSLRLNKVLTAELNIKYVIGSITVFLLREETSL